MKLLQEVDVEPNLVQRRISQLVHVHQMREEVLNNVQLYQDKMKNLFDRRTKADDFQINDLVLKWDARIEDKGKHSKFENLWKGPYKVATYHGNNVKFGSIDNHSPMRGHMGHPEASQEIRRINQSCEVLTKARGNVQPL